VIEQQTANVYVPGGYGSELMFYDTHVHFREGQGEYAPESVMARAREAGVTRMLAVGGSAELDTSALKATEQYSDCVSLAIGYDRDQAAIVTVDSRSLQAAVDRLRVAIGRCARNKIALSAIGEIGLDYHYSRDTAEQQKLLLNTQLSLAAELGLPVVVHSREAEEDTLDILGAHRDAWKGNADRIGVLHCFTGSKEFAVKLAELGYCISFSGIVTFRNADALRAAAKAVPDEKLLIETDSPYLAPVPMRGKRNEPALVAYVADALADVRGTGTETIARLTFENAERLFEFRFNWDMVLACG